jgi:hypothetical protein
MMQATYILYASKAQLVRLRAHVREHPDGEVSWRERRKLFGSEFHVSGPSRLAREAHERAATWLSRSERY